MSKWPQKIDLHAVAVSCQLLYQPAKDIEYIRLDHEDRQLKFTGPIQRFDDCKASLFEWLESQAHQHIEPWLAKLSLSTNCQNRLE